MAFNANFDSPQTASGRYVSILGTVPANTAFVEVMQITVSRFESGFEYFYLTKEYVNSTSSPSAVSESITIAAVPVISASDAVTFTSFGAIIGEVDLQ
ncbi:MULTISPECIES: hypothetical protein [Clostridium]|jgi:hypothetical protein|uniref:Uncharacterized protein n=1 Tax=Clostridium sartagoforme AAU1 TaxID=1202534 RepID=R9CCD3_9CLOT|nr:MULTISPECIES: hypothetical protein [Clostridium]EOR26952.1 hypothetical protein A500_06411 [Clostridium sartagoforme AAU1]KLE15334.1 hypothetical protein AAT22_12545 [Clostridium sp. C8]